MKAKSTWRSALSTNRIACSPSSHVHFAQKIAWFDTADDLPRYSRATGTLDPLIVSHETGHPLKEPPLD